MGLKRTHRRLKSGLEHWRVAGRQHLPPARPLPGFIIFGARKCGTTFLYRNLAGHPNVLPALKKEVRYFDLNYDKGERWYRAHFPTAAGAGLAARLWAGPVLTGESSPYYMFEPRVPWRVRALLPGVRLIALLRDPVRRAYSHYHHQLRRGVETLSFEAAIDREPERLAGETERLLREESYVSYNHQKFSYLASGRYADQLEAWYEVFAPEQILVLRSEAMYADPVGTLRRVLDFLGLPRKAVRVLRDNVPKRYRPMAPATRERLRAYFEPHNRRLYALLRRRGIDDFPPFE